MRRRPAILILTLLLGSAAAAAEGPRYQLIVHAETNATSLSRSQVSAIFLQRGIRWSDGMPVRPVDQVDSSPVREEFSKEVLGRRAAAVKSLWLQVIFSGRGLPPPEKKSDQDVLAYVAANKGAIGYVSGTCSLAPGVRPLRVEP